MTKFFCDHCTVELGKDALVVGTMRRRAGLGIRGYDADTDARFRPTDGYELCDACAEDIVKYLTSGQQSTTAFMTEAVAVHVLTP